ncbi:transposase [Bradyrhizobium sp. CCGUVB1N3]|uniref:transposase n=1 Tax=Bradyrhizobium sp. CCGUVB1N3 TaxID=2949629 RepID=UPI0020B1EA63|nr:transposase [Bradyrhizobium sp. CCGUVB1N3]MCP3475906.1 transposase [Bradyrhizobium sp. CCGUVB1N3]
MTISRAELITSVERRRRWSQDEKERLVAASLEPGATVSEVARMAGLHVSQLFRWRKELCKGQGACLFTKRLERGRFIWPSVVGESVTISPAQLSYLLSGIHWRNPQETQRPTRVG